MKIILSLVFTFAIYAKCNSQPFVDVFSINHQQLNTKTQNDSFASKINNTFAGIILPLKIDSSNYFIIRANAEILKADISGYSISESYTLKSFLLGIGWQHQFNSKITASLLVLPKITSDFKDKINENIFQCGASFLLLYKVKSNFRYKAGVYYNREPFGNFFVPLLGADILLNKKNWIYGQLPLYFRYEHKFNDKLYSGIGLRFFGRSFILSSNLNSNYIFNQENQVKVFADYYLRSKFVVYTELGRTINYGLKQYKNNQNRDDRIEYPRTFSSLNDGFFINFGLCYRIRNSF